MYFNTIKNSTGKKQDIQINETDTYTTQKIDSKWITDINLKPQSIKFLGEITEEKIHDKNSLQYQNCDT